MNPETAVHGIKLEDYLREGVLPPGLCVDCGVNMCVGMFVSALQV